MPPKNVALVLSLAILALPLVPPVRLLVQAGARRRLRVFPAFVRRLVLALAAYAVAIALLVRAGAPWLHLAAGAVAIAVLVERWQARPTFGTGRGLPPGSLAFGQVEPWRNQDYFREQVELHGPIFKTRLSPRPMIAVYGLDRGRKLLRKHDAQLGPGEPIPVHELLRGGFLRYLDREPHGEVTEILQAAFPPELLEAQRSAIGALVANGFAQRCEDPARPGLLRAAEIEDLIFAIVCRTFFGIEESSEIGHLRRLYTALDVRRGLLTRTSATRRALRAVSDILDSRVERYRDATGNTLPSALGNLARQPGAWSPPVAGNLIVLAMTGWLDVAGFMVWILKQLADHPGAVERIRRELEDPDPGAGPPLSLCAVQETVRLEQSEFLSRTVLEEFEFEGFRFPRGWRLRILEHENHRDPESFDRPDEFLPERFRDAPPTPKTFAAFGVYRIRCLGEHLTLAIGQSFVEELVRSYDWRVLDDGPVEFGGLHWQPSARFAVRLEPRGESNPIAPRTAGGPLAAGPDPTPAQST